jgi:hypothetical protein
MKEKYSFGWTDPRTTYGSYGSPDAPDVRWEFLEARPWPPSVRPGLTVLVVYLFIRVVL